MTNSYTGTYIKRAATICFAVVQWNIKSLTEISITCTLLRVTQIMFNLAIM